MRGCTGQAPSGCLGRCCAGGGRNRGAHQGGALGPGPLPVAGAVLGLQANGDSGARSAPGQRTLSPGHRQASAHRAPAWRRQQARRPPPPAPASRQRRQRTAADMEVLLASWHSLARPSGACTAAADAGRRKAQEEISAAPPAAGRRQAQMCRCTSLPVGALSCWAAPKCAAAPRRPTLVAFGSTPLCFITATVPGWVRKAAKESTIFWAVAPTGMPSRAAALPEDEACSRLPLLVRPSSVALMAATRVAPSALRGRAAGAAIGGRAARQVRRPLGAGRQAGLLRGRLT